MWKFLIKLAFLFLIYIIHQGFSFVLFNQVAFRCVDVNETLQMICTVKDLGLGAYIFQNNEEQAHCVSFPNIYCISFKQGNISVTVSNDTVFTIGSREKNSLNGTWTCRNGIGDMNENASIEIVSTQCQSAPDVWKGQSSPDVWKGEMKENCTKERLLLIIVPIVVIAVIISWIRCCDIIGQNIQNRQLVIRCMINLTNWSLKNIRCLWKYCFIGQNDNTRRKMKTVWQFLYCFVLCGVYLTAVVAVFYIDIGTDLEVGLIIFCCFLGLIVFVLIPIIWNAQDDIEVNEDPGGDEHTTERPTRHRLQIPITGSIASTTQTPQEGNISPVSITSLPFVDLHQPVPSSSNNVLAEENSSAEPERVECERLLNSTEGAMVKYWNDNDQSDTDEYESVKDWVME